jgi:hypothetical protein
LVLGESWSIVDQDELTHLELVSKIPEKLMKPVASLDEGDDAEPDQGETTSDKVVQPGAESDPLPIAARVMAAITRSRVRNIPEEVEEAEPMDPLAFQAERWRQIKSHQDADPHIASIKKILRHEFGDFSHAQIRRLSKEAELFALDAREVLYRLSHFNQESAA